MKRFNITGTCRPNEHYMVDITERVEIIRKMIAQGDYFCINRGRQYGKTTTLEGVATRLCDYYCVFSISFESLSDSCFKDEDTLYATFVELIASCFAWKELKSLDKATEEYIKSFESEHSEKCSFKDLIRFVGEVCHRNSKPVVLMIDEVDQAGNYPTFLKLLGVLRSMFLKRNVAPTFQSVILAGVYDVKNLKLKMRGEQDHQYNSPWNIAVPFNVDMSLQEDGIKGMLDEYECDHHTGMDTALVAKWLREYTSGYPFLVSRLCMLMDEQGDWSHGGFINAHKVLISERNTLFDDMSKNLMQFPELKALLQAILFNGQLIKFNPFEKFMQLSEMFAFVVVENGNVKLQNRILETVLYELFMAEERNSSIYLEGSIDKSGFVKGDELDMPVLLSKFAEHFNEIFRTQDGTMDYKFVENQGRKQFLLYLRPILNGDGHYYVEAQTRDETRTDLIINYHGHEYVVEMKIWRGESYNTRGEEQLAQYLDYFNRPVGYMVSFCFNKNKQPGLRPPVQIGPHTLIETVV